MNEPANLVYSSYDTSALAPAHFADRALLEALCGQRIHPKAFEIAPQGHRLIVVPDEVPDMLGSLHLPDSVKDTEQMGQGWVLSVGPLVAMPPVAHPGSPALLADAGPADLVGLHIYFGLHVGRPLRLTLNDRDYQAGIMMMTDRDILAVDLNPANDPVKEWGQELAE